MISKKDIHSDLESLDKSNLPILSRYSPPFLPDISAAINSALFMFFLVDILSHSDLY